MTNAFISLLGSTALCLQHGCFYQGSRSAICRPCAGQHAVRPADSFLSDHSSTFRRSLVNLGARVRDLAAQGCSNTYDKGHPPWASYGTLLAVYRSLTVTCGLSVLQCPYKRWQELAVPGCVCPCLHPLHGAPGQPPLSPRPCSDGLPTGREN